MSTLDTIVFKDYDKNIVLRDCQRQAFEYLHDKKGDLSVTTFETFTEIESLQGSTTLYSRLRKMNKIQNKQNVAKRKTTWSRHKTRRCITSCC